VWWGGLISVPIMAWLGIRERNKGYVLLVTAYLFQWLPWMTSPRVAFEYHFFPNLVIICLADAMVLQRVWQYGAKMARDGKLTFNLLGRVSNWPQLAVGGYCALVVALFVYFYPVLAGLHVPWNVWDDRMWHWIMRNAWI
jgi:dolichyl-phosphate-mannose--protein O-mannosyl transferase